MTFKTRFFEITIITRRERVKRDIQEHGKIWAVKMYRERYKCGLKEALTYVRSVAP